MYELFFENLALHIDLDLSEIEQITARLGNKSIKKNFDLLQDNNICKNIYFVNHGCLRIFNRSQNGEEHNIMLCPENWWATDLNSFSNQKPSFYSISALEDTQVLYLSYAAFEELLMIIPKLERFFRILFQNAFSMYQRRINSNLSKTAEERYQLFKKQYPQIETRIAQKHVASYLGITPVFLSVIRKRKS